MKSKYITPASSFNVYLWSLICAWTILIGCLLLVGIFQSIQIHKALAEKEALANFNKDQALRHWAAMHGGVYVPATDDTPPNPFLKHIPERDIKTPNGIALTLMNPAYMLRQTMAKYESAYGIRGHITSLKHFRIETAPDNWERKVLKEFEKGVKEVSEYTEMKGKPYFRLMSPMIAEKECLKCHGYQGYKEGDVRGGVSVSVPLAPYLSSQRKQIITYSTSFGLLWLLGLTGTLLASQQIKKKMSERDTAEIELLRAHDKLEGMVAARTAELIDTNEQLMKEIEEKRRVEDALLLKTRDLRQRIKELNCFYLISDLREKPGISIEEICMGVLDILVSSWQFPEITCSQITMNGNLFETENFKDTEWKMTSDILVEEKPVGSVKICYLEERPESDEGPFLKEERKLINAVAVRLGRIINYSQAMKKLQEVNEILEERVRQRTTDLQQRTEELSRLALQLTLAEERERRRIADLLHDDLQQLLVAIKINLENMSLQIQSDKRQDVQNIHAMVLDTLKKSRHLTAELSPPILNHHGLASALEWLANFMQRTHGLNAILKFSSKVEIFREDLRILLYRCVRELLLNTIKHARVDSVLIMMTVDDSNSVNITVSDEGIGFDPERFWQDRLRSQGYGLFSIKERLAMLGGSLEVVSAPGKGTTCKLVLPLNSEEKPLPAKQIFSEKVLPALSICNTGQKIRVLLADDHVVMREGLSTLLKTQPDIDIVAEAADGLQAVSLAQELRPDVILMDISMPKMNGIEAAKIILAKLPATRIIGLSMYDDEKSRISMLEAGAVAYLTKGGSSEALLTAICDLSDT